MPNVHSCCAWKMLDHRWEVRPVDCEQKSLRLRCNWRNDFRRTDENFRHHFIGSHSVWRWHSKPASRVTKSSTTRTTNLKRNFWLFVLLFSYHHWVVSLSDYVAWVAQKYEVKSFLFTNIFWSIHWTTFYRFLASTSVLICTSVAFLTWICILKESEEKTVTPIEVFDPSNPPLLNLLKAYGIISFQFDIHPMLLTIQVDMEDKRKIGRAVFGGLLTTCTLSLITTVLVHATYGQKITPNVLESLPKSWALYLIIMLVTLQLCLSSAVGNSALFQHVEDVFNVPRSEKKFWYRRFLFELFFHIQDFNYKRCIVRSILVWLAVLLGEFIPKFDLVMGKKKF